jgi:hypothetical protein
MAIDRLFQIKKWISYFFAFAIMVQVGLICYASGSVMPLDNYLSLQLNQIERMAWVSVLSISLNLVVIIVAVYVVNISIVNSFRCCK